MFIVTIYEKSLFDDYSRDTVYVNDFKSVVEYLEFRRTCVDANIEDVFITYIGDLHEGD